MTALPNSLRIDTSCTLVQSKDEVPGALPHRYNVSDIDMEIRKRLTIDIGIRTLTHQLKALPRSLDYACAERSWLLIGGTGTGKTYYYAGLFREMRRMFPERYGGMILFVTKASIQMQSQRVFQEFGLTNILVCSYDSLRSTLGSLYVEWKTTVHNGLPTLLPIWSKPEDTGICLIAADEVQSLKNEDSLQSMIFRQAANAGYQIIMSSATPFSRAQHLRTIALIMRPLVQLRKNGAVVRLTQENFTAWLSTISDKPSEWSPADMKRAMHALQHHIIKFEHVQFAHMFKIRQIVIPFRTPEHAAIYNAAFVEYQELRLKADKDPLIGFAAVLVALAKFIQKAEILRGEYLAKSAYECVNSRKRPINAIIATGFKDTLFIIKSLLISKYGVLEEQISVICGGQSKKERQQNIDRFNNEKSRYMLMMFKAGGAGLSLHHTKGKKYPSEVFLPPVWNSEDLVQVLGRAHRVTSMSTTYQNIIWFAGTEEERVAEKVKGKCAALREVVGKNESWADSMEQSQEIRSTRGQLSAAQIYAKETEEEDDDAVETDTLLIAAGDNANAIVHQLNI